MTTPIHPSKGSIKGTEDQHADTLGHNPSEVRKMTPVSDPFGDALMDAIEVDKNPKLSPRIKHYADSVYQAESKKEVDRRMKEKK